MSNGVNFLSPLAPLLSSQPFPPSNPLIDITLIVNIETTESTDGACLVLAGKIAALSRSPVKKKGRPERATTTPPSLAKASSTCDRNRTRNKTISGGKIRLVLAPRSRRDPG